MGWDNGLLYGSHGYGSAWWSNFRGRLQWGNAATLAAVCDGLGVEVRRMGSLEGSGGGKLWWRPRYSVEQKGGRVLGRGGLPHLYAAGRNRAMRPCPRTSWTPASSDLWASQHWRSSSNIVFFSLPESLLTGFCFWFWFLYSVASLVSTFCFASLLYLLLLLFCLPSWLPATATPTPTTYSYSYSSSYY